jgi:hypothetical protein
VTLEVAWKEAALFVGSGRFDLALLSRGTLNDVYLVRTIAAPIVMKYARAGKDGQRPGARYRSAYPENRLSLEADVMDVVRRNVGGSYAIPRVLGVATSERALFLELLVSREGGSLWESLEFPLSELLIRKIANAVNGISAISLPHNHARGTSATSFRDAKLRYSCLLPIAMSFRMSRVIRSRALDMHCRTVEIASGLTHGDLLLQNLVHCSDDRIGLVDFEESAMHDPTYDVASVLSSLILKALGDDRMRPELSGAVDLLLTDCMVAMRHASSELPWHERLCYYLAGILCDRVCGTGQKAWLSGSANGALVTQLAFTLLAHGGDPRSTLERLISPYDGYSSG